ncbi:MAG: choice-of-anchor J domain-containing protein, partial [Bacteroidales bacterium]|nr:choice-of-anchor J domain-containing protein [Bacteroidales bacterium]
MKRFLFFLMAITFAITGFSQTALNEGFEGAVFPPEGWTKATTQGNESWSRHTSNNPIGTSCASVDKQIEGHVNYLITPKLSITEELNTIRFWCKFSEQLIGTELYVLISTTDNQLSSFDEGYRIAYSGYGSTQWTQKEVALSEYLGENIYVAFKVVDQNGARVFLDDFTGPNLYSSLLYPTPTLLQVSNPTSTGIDLGWNDPTGFAWNIQYMLASETDWEYAERVFTTTNPYTLNLNNSSIYKARVKQNGHVGYSDWSYSITFRTACDAITMLPWYEDFDYPWDDVYVEPGNKTAPYCWFNIDSVNTAYYWQSSDSPKNGNSAICMHGYDGESSSTDEAHKNNDWLISPIISFTGAEQLTFWAKKSSDLYNPDLLIYAMDVSQGDLNATASNANFILVGSADTLLTTNYEKLKFDLSCLVGNHRLAFVRKKTASGSVFVDEVLVNAICQKITGLNATSIVSYELYIGWDDHSAPMYELEFIDESETDWTYSYTWSSYNNPAQIIDLPFDACSVHKVRARAVCDFGDWSDPSDWNDHSDWTDPLLFTVGGYPISYLPYEENFDWWNTGDSIIPDCWVRTTNQENYPFIDTGGYFNNCLTFYAESPGTYNIIAMETIDEYIPITSIKANFYYKNFSLTDKLIV